MSEVKWIKISTDIFDNWKIKQIKAMPEGYKMICVWFQLLCLCGKCNESGLIILSGKVVANDELLSNIFGEDLKIVQLSLKTFEAFGMIEVATDGITKVSNWDEYQNSEGLERIREYERTRKAKQRERNKRLEDKNCHGQVPDKSGDSSLSYSISNSNSFSSSKSNISNLKYILDTYEEEYRYITDNSELLDAVKGWMEYKDHKKPKASNHYDTERGMRTLLSKTITWSKEYGIDSVIEIINDSIANNYQGITWDLLSKRKKQRNVFDEWRNA